MGKLNDLGRKRISEVNKWDYFFEGKMVCLSETLSNTLSIDDVSCLTTDLHNLVDWYEGINNKVVYEHENGRKIFFIDTASKNELRFIKEKYRHEHNLFLMMMEEDFQYNTIET